MVEAVAVPASFSLMNTDNNNVLDVEDDDQRQARIRKSGSCVDVALTSDYAEALLEKLNSDSRPQPPPGLQFDLGNKPPFDVNSPAERLYHTALAL